MVFERLTKLFNAGGASRPPKELEAALLVVSLKPWPRNRAASPSCGWCWSH